MRTKIITHCYASQLPFFATCLKFQLQSISVTGVDNDVEVNVCFNRDDIDTVKVLRWYETNKVRRHKLVTFEFPVEELGRRSIGRNKAALWSKADIVWFTDVDYCFCDGIFNKLESFQWPEGASMVFPGTIMIHKNHAMGDELLKIHKNNDIVPLIVPDDFTESVLNRAIGGVQIVQGDFAYEHGYLKDEEKWQRPTVKPFGDFRDDIAYRKFCLKYGTIEKVELPGIYRIRHTETTYQ